MDYTVIQEKPAKNAVAKRENTKSTEMLRETAKEYTIAFGKTRKNTEITDLQQTANSLPKKRERK